MTAIPILLVVCSTASAGKIEGTVKDITGGVIPNAVVWGESVPRPWPSSVHTVSDDRGHFLLDGLEPATWTVYAQCPGFARGTQKVELKDSDTREITITLQIEQEKTEIEVDCAGRHATR
jgi:hypothetical protein